MNKEESVLQGRLRMLGIIERIMNIAAHIGNERKGLFYREDERRCVL